MTGDDRAPDQPATQGEPTGIDLVRRTLEEARAAARAQGKDAGRGRAGAPSSRRVGGQRRSWSGPGPDVRDRLVDRVENLLLGQPVPELGRKLRQHLGKRLDRAKRRRPAPGAQKADRALGQAGTGGQVGGAEPRPVHRPLEGIGKRTHIPSKHPGLTFVKSKAPR